jgi:hypothetical protein
VHEHARKDRMTRIGFTYNMKPEPEPMPLDAGDEESAREEEPPSRSVNDQYAEWDDAQTIDAVEHALSKLGEVVRL